MLRLVFAAFWLCTPARAQVVSVEAVSAPLSFSIGASASVGAGSAGTLSLATNLLPSVGLADFRLPAPWVPSDGLQTARISDIPSVQGAAVDADRLPQGAKSVRSDFIRSPEEVETLIPGGTSSNLVQLLKPAIRKFGPLRVLTYDDAIGGKFIGLDLRNDARWLDHIPELWDHEKILIRKILARNPDVQVVVREKGKTPDLVVAGMITELKSVKDGYPLEKLLEKANVQVSEFSHRHMLAGGDAAVDLMDEKSVPLERVARLISGWARAQPQMPSLQRIWVFAGRDLKTFCLRPDGSYALVEREPWGPPILPERPVHEASVDVVKLLAKRGLLSDAHAVLRSLEISRPPEPDADAPVVRAREYLEGKRTLLRIRKLAFRPGYEEEARQVWERFQRTHSEPVVRKIAPDVEALFRSIEARRARN